MIEVIDEWGKTKTYSNGNYWDIDSGGRLHIYKDASTRVATLIAEAWREVINVD